MSRRRELDVSIVQPCRRLLSYELLRGIFSSDFSLSRLTRGAGSVFLYGYIYARFYLSFAIV